MKRIVWAFLVMLLAMPAEAAAPVVSDFTLENGLKVVVIENHRVPAVSHMLWYKVGSADDLVGQSGLAHYLEHMMFLGTKQVPAGEFAAIIMRLGGEKNAFTTRDYTAYVVNIAKEHLARVMELEADRMRNLSPPEKEFAREQKVIIEERKSTVDNRPVTQLYEQMDGVLYRNHPYGTPVIGWLHEMEKLSLVEVRAAYARFYHPNNAILVVAGDVSADEVKLRARKNSTNISINGFGWE